MGPKQSAPCTFPRPSYLSDDKSTQFPLRAKDGLAGTFDPAGILLLIGKCPKRDIVEIAVSSSLFFRF